jgi:hypothetical protein
LRVDRSASAATKRNRYWKWRRREIAGWPELDAMTVPQELGMTVKRFKLWIGDTKCKRNGVTQGCRSLEILVVARKLASLMGIGMEELVDRWVGVEEEKRAKLKEKEVKTYE